MTYVCALAAVGVALAVPAGGKSVANARTAMPMSFFKIFPLCSYARIVLPVRARVKRHDTTTGHSR